MALNITKHIKSISFFANKMQCNIVVVTYNGIIVLLLTMVSLLLLTMVSLLFFAMVSMYCYLHGTVVLLLTVVSVLLLLTMVSMNCYLHFYYTLLRSTFHDVAGRRKLRMYLLTPVCWHHPVSPRRRSRHRRRRGKGTFVHLFVTLQGHIDNRLCHVTLLMWLHSHDAKKLLRNLGCFLH